MKKHFFVVASSLFFGGIFLVAITFFKSQANLSQARAYNISELLSSEYVSNHILSSNGEYDDSAREYIFNNEKHALPYQELKQLSQRQPPASSVLGAYSEDKRIIVDLEHQRVYAYEGDQLVFNFLVSTGKWGATPVGSYRIWYKVRSQVMDGGSKELGTYYYLPNVQWVQYFNNGIGLHSTYWHNNFGTPMSHGCVNMTTTDAETIYHWASPDMQPGMRIFRSRPDNPGTRVDVVETWTI